MDKAELYRKAKLHSFDIMQVLRSEYRHFTHVEMTRLIGRADNLDIDRILLAVYTRLPEISSDSEVEQLVFDCIRKDIVQMLKDNRLTTSTVQSSVLVDAQWPCRISEEDDMRLDIVMFFLNKKQRNYFLDRYYFLRKETTVIPIYEYIISRLINGKFIATFRFRELGIPRRKIISTCYADYFDRIDSHYIGRLYQSNAFMESTRIGKVPGIIRIMERHYLNASLAVPISLAVLFFILLLYGLFS